MNRRSHKEKLLGMVNFYSFNVDLETVGFADERVKRLRIAGSGTRFTSSWKYSQ